jgi:hypothetical protein
MIELSEPTRLSGVVTGIADADRAGSNAKAQAANPINKSRFIFLLKIRDLGKEESPNGLQSSTFQKALIIANEFLEQDLQKALVWFAAELTSVGGRKVQPEFTNKPRGDSNRSR